MFKFLILLSLVATLSSVGAAPLTAVQRVDWCKGTAAASWVHAVVHIDRYQKVGDYEFIRNVALTEIGGMKNLSRVSRFAAISYVQNFTPAHSIALEKYVVDSELTKGVTRTQLAKTMRGDVKRLMDDKYESCMRELDSSIEFPK